MDARLAILAAAHLLLFGLTSSAGLAAGDPTGAERIEDAPPRPARIAFLTLGDPKGGGGEIGPYINNEVLRESARVLRALPEDQQPDVVVLLMSSSGGDVAEAVRLTNTIQYEIKPHYRTVAWVGGVFREAAPVVWVCEEICFSLDGIMGGSIMASGPRPPGQIGGDERIDALLVLGERASRWGKRDPAIMRAMQVSGPWYDRKPLTADIGADGAVTWYDGEGGEFTVCESDWSLELTAPIALKFGLAEAAANSKDQLAAKLGFPDWIEVGQEAELTQQEHRKQYRKNEQQLRLHNAKLIAAMRAAKSAPDEGARLAHINEAESALEHMREILSDSPPHEKFGEFDREWIDGMQEGIDWLNTAHSESPTEPTDSAL